MARILLSALFFALACHTTEATPNQISTAKSGGPARVTLINAAGESSEIEVELAANAAEREHGLMDRAQMAPSHGMLFIFPRESAQTFWMKDTLIALDMVFIRADMTVLGIVSDAEPLTLSPRGVAGQSKYVLEVVGGYAEKHHWAAGTRVKFDNVSAVPVN